MKYYDKHGNEITDGCYIRFPDGSEHLIVAVDNPVYPLGYDATNQAWIDRGRAFPGEYGFYALTPLTAKESVLTHEEVPQF